VPSEATQLTPWKMTRLAKSGYYFKEIREPSAESKLGDGKTVIRVDRENLDPETDIHALAIDKIVSITPLSMDFTSRVDLSNLQSLFDE